MMWRRAAKESAIGVFADVDSLFAAARALRAEPLGELEILSPVPLHGADEVLGARRSPIRYYTLAGALLGFLAGWALTIGSALYYPLIVGGKPIVSLTPFGVIAYICTILFGALFTVAGLLIHAGLPRLRLGAGYDARLTGNRFGVQVYCGRQRLEEVGYRLLELGAEEVRYVEG
jgi:hypothetical protein